MKKWILYPLVATAVALPVATTLVAKPLPKPLQAIEAKGVKIVGTFDAPNGLQGYAAEYRGQGIAFYLLPDGKHVLTGRLLDADGNDLTKAPLDRLVYAKLDKDTLKKLEASAWIADGRKDAPRIVYVISDPNCPYCNMFWQQARPWVDAGKVQLRHIMVGIIKSDSPGKSAALLASPDPSKALYEHEKAGKASQLKAISAMPAAIQEKFERNMSLLEPLGVSATPTIIFQDKDGGLQQVQGAPQSDRLEVIMGGKP